jgi:hypothetical protein
MKTCPPKVRAVRNQVAGDKSQPDSLGTLLVRYLESLDLQNYSQETIKKRRLQLNAFVDWCELRSLTRGFRRLAARNWSGISVNYLTSWTVAASPARFRISMSG